MSPVEIAVAMVATQRFAELALSWRNARALMQRGAVEHGRSHYAPIVTMHSAWLAAMLLWVPAETQPNWTLAALYLALQGVRAWAILSLGPYWTTRVLTVADAPLVERGPYRLLRHPIYAVVVAEIALLPLMFGAWPIAVVFSVANLILLSWRIQVEDKALAPRRSC